MVYYVKDVGLSPLQMVLVGTTLEVACFLFEVPTGIVADLYSRRLSIIIGFTLIGAGFLLQGLVPAFIAILAAQVLWGIGYSARRLPSSVRGEATSAHAAVNRRSRLDAGTSMPFVPRQRATTLTCWQQPSTERDQRPKSAYWGCWW